MKQIQHKVNIVPIIGKADTLTEPEMRRLKRRIMSDIQENNIQVLTLGHSKCEHSRFSGAFSNDIEVVSFPHHRKKLS